MTRPLTALRHQARLLACAIVLVRGTLAAHVVGVLAGYGLWSLLAGPPDTLILLYAGLGICAGDVADGYDDALCRPRRWTTGLLFVTTTAVVVGVALSASGLIRA